MSGKSSAARVKDVLTEHISRDVKAAHYSDMSEVVDMVTNSNSHAQALCEHLDHVLLHGIRECEHGYWPFVKYFTRSEAIQQIKNLSNITTDLGRGRAWLYMALNEQAMESYIRMFMENQDITQEYYLRESFIRDCERLSVVLTLVSGLDFVNFELNVESDYLDHSPTAPSAHMGIFRSSEFTPNIEPTFISALTPEAKHRQEKERQLQQPSTQGSPSAERSSFTLSGIIDSVFKGDNTAQKPTTPTDHAQVPPPTTSGPAQPQIPAQTTKSVEIQKQTSVDSSTAEKSSFSLTGILGSVFKGGETAQRQATPTDSSHSMAVGHEGAATSTNRFSSFPPYASHPSLDESNDRRSSSEEPSRFHRTMIQDPVSPSREVFHSDSPNQMSMLMRQDIKSDVIGRGGGGAEDDDVVVERETRSKKSKGKKKKKKKKVSSSAAVDVTDSPAPAASDPTTSLEGGAKKAEKDEQDPSMSLDDFVDTFGRGGVEAAHPMPAKLQEVEQGESSHTPGEGSGLVEAMMAGKSMYDYDPPEPLPSGDDQRVGDGEVAVKDKPLSVQTDAGRNEQEDESSMVENDRDFHVSPDFVKRDLLSEALEELDGDGGGGGGVREKELASPFVDVDNSSPEDHHEFVDSLPPVSQSVTDQGMMDERSSQSHREEQKIVNTSPSEDPLATNPLLEEGNSLPESKGSPSSGRGERNAPQKSSLQSSSDSAIQASSQKSSFASSWSNPGQYMLKLPSKRGFKRPRFLNEWLGGTRERSRNSRDEVVDEFDVIELPKPRPPPEALPRAEPRKHSSPPQRPNEITARDKQAADITVDENMRLVFSLEVLFSTNEDLIRLVQVATPTGLGQQSIVFVLITSEALYILKKDGTEGMFSKQLAIKYSCFDHIVLGLGGQSLILVYSLPSSSDFGREKQLEKFVLITGNEAVSRSLFISIREAATKCPGHLRPVPLNRDDESRIDAVEKELITKLGSNTSFEIVRYCLVHWEQLSGEAPDMSDTAANETGKMSGNLLAKSTNMLGITSWKQGFFELQNGYLYHFNSDSDHVAKNIYQLSKCGGCMRISGENKPFTFVIHGEESLVLSAANEEELTQWLQALCLAAVESKMIDSPTHSRKTYSFCAILLTKNKIHVLHEDWSDESVQLVTCCEITDVNKVSIDSSLPFYCTVSYDSNDIQGEWLICFNSELELGKFETALASTWRDEFQIDLDFCEVTDGIVRQRAHRAVELMQSIKHRSDSVTRGRTELTYSVNF